MRAFIGITLAIALLYGCAASTKKFAKYIPAGHDVVIGGEGAPDSAKLLYVTCGMMVLEYHNDAILFDPFFSYQTFGNFLTGIKSSEKYYQRFKQLADTCIDPLKVKSAFISHTHYDHLMDLPLLMSKNYFPNLKTVYGNEFLPDMMFHWRSHAAFKAIEDDQVFNPKAASDQFEWLKITPNCEVLPVASAHAPQKWGLLLINSKLDKEYFRKEKFKNPAPISNVRKWDVGCNYSFLVRLKKADGSYFKILVQTSASNPPYGLPPRNEHADVAVLCLASMQEVIEYPKYFLESTGARELILVHWEDFFRHPKSNDDVKIVRETNKKLVLKRLQEVESLTQKPEVMMPKPGSLLRFFF
jgi:hypothetical protein